MNFYIGMNIEKIFEFFIFKDYNNRGILLYINIIKNRFVKLFFYEMLCMI